jgi:Family of unknown function (DUF6629)
MTRRRSRPSGLGGSPVTVKQVCFSAEADLVGGVAIGGIGVDAVRHISARPKVIAIAALPIILGLHQLDEALVWWSTQGHVASGIGTAALWIYLVIALVFLPVYVPLAVMLHERGVGRRRVISLLVLLGAGVAAFLLVAIVRGPIGVAEHPYHLSYSVPSGGGLPVILLYVVAVCGALLLSEFRPVVVFGVVNILAISVIARLTLDGFASVWCGWAALTSGLIAVYLRLSDPRRKGDDLAARTNGAVDTG